MSVKVMTAVWELSLPDSQKIVLLALADCANDEGHCWPSMATLATKCSKGERTVQGVIKQLVEAGHLTRNEVPGKGCNYYVHPVGPTAAPAPRSACAPQPATQTPAASADKPSRTINNRKETRAHKLPDDWKPKQFGSASKSRATVDSWTADEYTERIEAFTAHHRSKGSKFEDWQAAWSTWVLNSRSFNRKQSNDRKPSDEIQNPYARVAARREADRAAVGF